MTVELNKEIFELVSYVTKKQKPKKRKVAPEKELIGIPVLINLGKVENIKESQPDVDGNTLEAYKNEFGLNAENYRKLSDISNRIIELKPYSEYASVDFIEEHLFDWIIETHHKNKAEKNPLNYLQDEFDKDFNEYNFYFKIHALGIESSFKIGNVDFIFFTDEILAEYCEEFKKENPKKPVKEFEQFFDGFKSKPIAKVTAKGIKKRAKQNAQKQVNLAIDILKCFLVEDSVKPTTKLMDSEYRFKDNFPTWYIYDTNSEKFDFNSAFERSGGIAPVELNSAKVNRLLNSGMQEVSNFVLTSPQNELANIIHRTITKIGEYSSEENLHERVIKIISLYEFLFIPVTKGKGKGQTIIKSRILTKIIGESERPMIIRIFNQFYDIRDKLLHNGIEKYIDLNDLFKVQQITLFLLKTLIDLNKTLKTSQDLHEYFGIKTGSNNVHN